MSIVVAVRKNGQTVMAADSLTSFGEGSIVPQENSKTRKMYRLGDSIIGAAGWALYDDILNDYLDGEPAPDLSSPRRIFAFFIDLWKALHEDYTFVNDQAQSKDTPFGDLDTTFLIVNHAGIFKVSSDLGVTPFERYDAIGSGSEYAFGAIHTLYPTGLDAAEIATRAVHTAMAFDATCGGETALLAVE